MGPISSKSRKGSKSESSGVGNGRRTGNPAPSNVLRPVTMRETDREVMTEFSVLSFQFKVFSFAILYKLVLHCVVGAALAAARGRGRTERRRPRTAEGRD